MPYADSHLIVPSAEFVTLCQSQVALLTQSFNADWSAVYVTQDADKPQATQLIPLVIYPQTEKTWQNLANILALPAQLPLPSAQDTLQQQAFIDDIQQLNQNPSDTDYPDDEHHQLVLPLIHQDRVMGLLVTGRKDRQWESDELNQIEKIAQTMAIARLLDQRPRRLQARVQQQQTIQQWERDKIDDLLHQLRNPLTALRTFGKLLLKRFAPETDEKIQSVIQGIVRESDRLQDLLEDFETDFQEIAQNERKQSLIFPEKILPQSAALLLPAAPIPLEKITFQEMVTPLLITFEAIAQEKNITLSTQFEESSTPIQANFKALREVLTNLIENALKYTPKKGKIVIQTGLTRTWKEKFYQGIAIKDTGYGIPLEDQEHIFERYYRGIQGKGNIPGTGLGLAIVKELVEQMQGKIEVISPNLLSQNSTLAGTTFTVWLLNSYQEE